MAAAADVLPGAVDHARHGQFAERDGCCWLRQFGQSRADVTVFCREEI